MSETTHPVQETLNIEPQERLANCYILFEDALRSEHAASPFPRRDFLGKNHSVTTEESSVDTVAWDGKRYTLRIIRTQLDKGGVTETFVISALNPSEHTEVQETKAYGLKFEIIKGSPYVRETITADHDGKKIQERLYDDEENIKRITAKFDGLAAVKDIYNPSE